MRVPSHPSYLLRMLQGRLKKLATTSPVLAATFGQYTHRCGRPSCRCHHGGPKHAAFQLTFKDQGRSRSVYVPKDLVDEVRQWLAAQDRLDQLLHEIHQLSTALIRTHVQHRRRRKGRP